MSVPAIVARGSRRLMLVSTLIIAALSVQAAGQAPAGPDAWEQLAAAPEGSRVKVMLRDGSEVRGRIVLVRADAMVLDEIQTGAAGVRTPAGASLRDGLTVVRDEVASATVLSRAQVGTGVARSFEQLGVLVSPGQKISVTDVEGRRYSGTIAGLSSSSLSVMVGNELRQLRESDIAALRQRRSDSLGNGALWGLAAGVTVGMVQCGRCHVGPGLAIGALYGGAGASIGVALDALVKSDLVVYQNRGSAATRVSVVPQLAPSHQGVALSIKF